jgi:gamma-glutamylcyclotransferase
MEDLPNVVEPDHGWYFAYGSNLSQCRMEQRTGAVPPARKAWLNHYRLSFNLHADEAIYANIVPSPQSIVWGVAYWISGEMMNALDGYEAVAIGHYRRSWVEVETEDGERLRAATYIGGGPFVGAEGRPSNAYLQLILAGAREHNLPETYVRRVQAALA